MEQAQDPTLIGAIAALIAAIVMMIRQGRNGHWNGNGSNGKSEEAKIAAEVERRVKLHDLRNDMGVIALSVQAQKLALDKALVEFGDFREVVTSQLSSINTKLELYQLGSEGSGSNG